MTARTRCVSKLVKHSSLAYWWNPEHQPEKLLVSQTSTLSSEVSGSRLTGWLHSVTCDSAGGSDWSAGPSAVCSEELSSASVSPVDWGEATFSAARRVCGDAGCGAEADGTSWQGGGSVWGCWSGGVMGGPDAWSAGEPVSDMVTCNIDNVVLYLHLKSVIPLKYYSLWTTDDTCCSAPSKPQFILQSWGCVLL